MARVIRIKRTSLAKTAVAILRAYKKYGSPMISFTQILKIMRAQTNLEYKNLETMETKIELDDPDRKITFTFYCQDGQVKTGVFYSPNCHNSSYNPLQLVHSTGHGQAMKSWNNYDGGSQQFS